MYKIVLKWFCFILVCADTVSYMMSKMAKNKSKAIGISIGLIIGILARIFVLYGTATCWLLV